jgi:hypothetical protein
MAGLSADRVVWSSATNPAPYAGRYTLAVAGGDVSDPSFPAGIGYGAVVVETTGKVIVSGALADGTPVSQTTRISKDGRWPLYVPLYAGKGSVWSWLFFTNAPPPTLQGGQLSWSKPALGAATKYYPQGFTNTVEVAGSPYLAPTNAAMRVLALTNGSIRFSGGNLAAPFTNLVVLTAGNLVTNASTNRLTFSLTPASGTFSGSVVVPGTRTTNAFKGALLQDEDAGYGYFLGTNTSGPLILTPRH